MLTIIFQSGQSPPRDPKPQGELIVPETADVDMQFTSKFLTHHLQRYVDMFEYLRTFDR
jgi:hypothetical protein